VTSLCFAILQNRLSSLSRFAPFSPTHKTQAKRRSQNLYVTRILSASRVSIPSSTHTMPKAPKTTQSSVDDTKQYHCDCEKLCKSQLVKCLMECGDGMPSFEAPIQREHVLSRRKEHMLALPSLRLRSMLLVANLLVTHQIFVGLCLWIGTHNLSSRMRQHF
jgi:hypothetical protein